MSGIITVKDNEGEVLGLIIKSDFKKEGVEFFTPSEYSQQLAYMHHPSGKVIEAHVHNLENRNVVHTQEVLAIRKGVLRVDFYLKDYTYLESYLLNAGDIILLASGGHGFEVIEEVEMVEVKQGPYLGDKDKTRFQGVDNGNIMIKG